MAADDNTLGLMLDDLSLGLVMVDPDDLISMGEVLQKNRKYRRSGRRIRGR